MKLKTLLTLITLIAICSVSYAQTYSVLYAFTGGSDGRFPLAGVTIRGGSLFGTTSQGGTIDNPVYGAVYQMVRSGSQWNFNVISSLTDPNGPRNPEARVMFGPEGHAYTTTNSGAGNSGDGTVLQFTPPLSICKTVKCFWAQKVIHQFIVYPDGSQPCSADITFDPQGNLYGSTCYGGDGSKAAGMVYELQPSGNAWTEDIVYQFQGQPDGETPGGGVIRDKNGNLFGTTVVGGQYDNGSVWELSNVPGVGWVETILYSFQNNGDGERPWAGLVMDQAGNLYGAASGSGGLASGTIFELSPSGNTWTFNVIRSGVCSPVATLTLDAAGSLYGTTPCGGAPEKGNVFKLSKSGNGWQYSSLYEFTGGADGGDPLGSVAIDTDGTLYGTTNIGGSFGCGVVWMIKP